jgi:hypothetical protein
MHDQERARGLRLLRGDLVEDDMNLPVLRLTGHDVAEAIPERYRQRGARGD